MKKNFFLILAILIQVFFYTNRLNLMIIPENGNETSEEESADAPREEASPPSTPTPPRPQQPPVIETQATWPTTIEIENMQPLIKSDNKIIVNFFNQAEKTIQDIQIALKNIESLRDTLVNNVRENSEKAQILLEETMYKKGVIMEQLLQSKKGEK